MQCSLLFATLVEWVRLASIVTMVYRQFLYLVYISYAHDMLHWRKLFLEKVACMQLTALELEYISE